MTHFKYVHILLFEICSFSWVLCSAYTISDFHLAIIVTWSIHWFILSLFTVFCLLYFEEVKWRESVTISIQMCTKRTTAHQVFPFYGSRQPAFRCCTTTCYDTGGMERRINDLWGDVLLTKYQYFILNIMVIVNIHV